MYPVLTILIVILAGIDRIDSIRVYPYYGNTIRL